MVAAFFTQPVSNPAQANRDQPRLQPAADLRLFAFLIDKVANDAADQRIRLCIMEMSAKSIIMGTFGQRVTFVYISQCPCSL